MKILILGNQLYPEWGNMPGLEIGDQDQVLMIEDLGVARHYRFHKLRILHTFVSMRAFRDQLIETKVKIRYFELPESSGTSFWDRLKQEIGAGGELGVSEIADRGFDEELKKFCSKNKIRLTLLPSPHFLCPKAEFKDYLKKAKRPFMKTFYERERKRLNILIDQDGAPTGGQWSFDSENRKKLPKDYHEPKLLRVPESPHETEVRVLIDRFFPDHPGSAGPLIVPHDTNGARKWLQDFLKHRFADFGPYEDALTQNFDVLNHSLLSPLINLGLLSPREVIDAALIYAKKHQTPMASLEGFVRQIMGWREFVRGVDQHYGEEQSNSNFWKHGRKLKACWYEGNTGIPPLDNAIQKANRLAYNHHIERLMVISNLMLLCEIHPKEAHRWFMEMYLDSYEWVMGPNVYGMGLMSDGGIFATKPYISGSNYILKMSDYKKGPWCDIWDGLYWSFIDRHRSFFSKNPRLSMMVSLLDKMETNKKIKLFAAASAFKERVSAPGSSSY